MKEYDFAIIYELKKREIESDILLSLELENRGYKVGIFRLPFPQYSLPFLNNKAKVVVASALYNNNIVYKMCYRRFRAAKKVVNLMWEQIRKNIVVDNTESYHYPHESAVYAYHLCWGQYSVDNLKKANIQSNHLIKTGAIHLDYLSEGIKEYFMSREVLFEKYAIDNKNKVHLFISSFAYANRDERALERYKKKQLGYDVVSFAKLSNASQKKVLEWIDEFLETHPNDIIIYRRHPAENNSEGLDLLEKKRSNFKSISELSVKQWILACDKIMVWYSTSVAEIHYANKEYAIIRPYEIPYENEVTILNNSSKITSYEMFNSYLEGKTNYESPIKDINYYYDNNSTPSYIRVADELEKIYNSDDEFPWRKYKKYFFKRRISDIFSIPVLGVYRLIMPLISLLYKNASGEKEGFLNNLVVNYRNYIKYLDNSIAKEKEIKEIKEKVSKFI